jgi:hypothetical protein
MRISFNVPSFYPMPADFPGLDLKVNAIHYDVNVADNGLAISRRNHAADQNAEPAGSSMRGACAGMVRDLFPARINARSSVERRKPQMNARFRLLPEDEYMHPAGPESNFNESVYSNAFDGGTGVGGWMRVGNRVNEGHAEKSVVLYLPDGRIACAFGRPEISANDKFFADGLTVETIEPFRHQRMRYRGEVMLLDNGEALRDPKRLFETAPRAAADILWEHRSTNPLHGGVPLDATVETMYGRDFSLGHFNQHTRVSGHVRIGEQAWEMAGHGWRDHSWGPRHWSNLFIYRLFLATFDDRNGLMLLKIYDKTGRARSVGAMLIDGVYDEVMDLSVITDWTSDLDMETARIGVRTATRSLAIEVERVSAAPLRNRRQDGETHFMSRITETQCLFRWEGREAWGMSEYIERLQDGRPIGPPV